MINVLIVDDNDNNRLTLELLLEELESVEINEAENGQIAVEMCAKQSFDMIFMDIMMPVMDGFEATKYIKQLNKNTMIIALSALDDDASKQKILALGAEDYLTKPIKAEIFFMRMKHYLRIMTLRKKRLEAATLVQNPFDKTIFGRLLIFKVASEESLSEFWDYWLNSEKNIADLSDHVRIIYGFGLWLLNNAYSFTIEVEESESNLYMMLKIEGAIRSAVIRNILMKHLPTSKYILSPTMLSFRLNKVKEVDVREIDSKTKEILTKTHGDAIISAKDYIEETALSFISKIDNLDTINDQIDQTIILFEKTPNTHILHNICDDFQEYADTLEQLVDFAHLGFGIQTLINFLQTLTDDQFEPSKIKKLSSMLLNLLHDLSAWRENVFMTQVARDIHYLDASLLSSCLQIETIFEDKELETDDIEFF